MKWMGTLSQIVAFAKFSSNLNYHQRYMEASIKIHIFGTENTKSFEKINYSRIASNNFPALKGLKITS